MLMQVQCCHSIIIMHPMGVCILACSPFHKQWPFLRLIPRPGQELAWIEDTYITDVCKQWVESSHVVQAKVFVGEEEERHIE